MALPLAPPRAHSCSAFPFLTGQEFESACCFLVDRLHMLGDSPAVGCWSSIQLTRKATGPILKISRNIDINHHDEDPMGSDRLDESQLELHEDDPEAHVRKSDPRARLQVNYEIIFSSTYQVPVLFFTLRHDSHPGPLGLDAVYQYLVSDQHRNELQSVGVMGSISFGYHPESGTPASFVHPCNTADAMRCIAGQQAVDPDTYLIIWLGLVGSRLGLHLPSAIFVANDQARTQGE
ncbi:autophagy-related protein Atg10 [Aspergillus campestris IBT 28561]|uniref:Ubiquitin-like-conjugating enzyme ATG10 n=1 Tax=Aspergillus campestris (strain IBT 28561) TaxID=1392248 RepID=A0A2I1D2B3_ASPC2|nr:autophagy-related protein Atg10 [Aspergillus campestris IBT 28561]PKY04011.1 autophagy-related protein Atg10 [Aspergillus campestris IBT 28561]